MVWRNHRSDRSVETSVSISPFSTSFCSTLSPTTDTLYFDFLTTNSVPNSLIFPHSLTHIHVHSFAHFLSLSLSLSLPLSLPLSSRDKVPPQSEDHSQRSQTREHLTQETGRISGPPLSNVTIATLNFT